MQARVKTHDAKGAAACVHCRIIILYLSLQHDDQRRMQCANVNTDADNIPRWAERPPAYDSLTCPSRCSSRRDVTVTSCGWRHPTVSTDWQSIQRRPRRRRRRHLYVDVTRASASRRPSSYCCCCCCCSLQWHCLSSSLPLPLSLSLSVFLSVCWRYSRVRGGRLRRRLRTQATDKRAVWLPLSRSQHPPDVPIKLPISHSIAPLSLSLVWKASIDLLIRSVFSAKTLAYESKKSVSTEIALVNTKLSTH